MSSSHPRDTFDTARTASAVGLIAAGIAAIVGTALDWVTVEEPRILPRAEIPRATPFTGLETGHGTFIVIAAALVIVFAVLLAVRRRSTYAWLAFFASIVVGGIAISNYRGVEGLFYDEMQRVGKPTPALGLILVAAAGIVGIIAAAAGVAASPRRDDDE